MDNEDAFIQELINIMTGQQRGMARFEVKPQFCSPDEVGHLCVAAAHEAYLQGLAHGRGTPREETDATSVEEYTDMTYAAAAAVLDYQDNNPLGYRG